MKEIASLIRFFFIKLGVTVDLPTKKHLRDRIGERRKSTKDDGRRTRLVIFTTSASKQLRFYMRILSCVRNLHYSHKCNYCPWHERCGANFPSCVVMGRRFLCPGTNWPTFANSFITVFFRGDCFYFSILFSLLVFQEVKCSLKEFVLQTSGDESVFDGLLSEEVETCGLVHPSKCRASFQICSSVETDLLTGLSMGPNTSFSIIQLLWLQLLNVFWLYEQLGPYLWLYVLEGKIIWKKKIKKNSRTRLLMNYERKPKWALCPRFPPIKWLG